MSSRWAGPSRKSSTSATVQCQKCLQRGHYSYECKGSVQERPYVPRPSRTQRLLNPKLAPKLFEPAPVKNNAALADEELAKREAERAKKRKMEEEEEDVGDNDSGDFNGKIADSPRPRSGSSSSERSLGPPRRRDERVRDERSAPLKAFSRRTRSPSDDRDYRRDSPSPVRESRRWRATTQTVSRSRSRSHSPSRSISPPRRRQEASSRSRSPVLRGRYSEMNRSEARRLPPAPRRFQEVPPRSHKESSHSRSRSRSRSWSPPPRHRAQSPRFHSDRCLDESTEQYSPRRSRSPVTSRKADHYDDTGGGYYRERDRRGDDRPQGNGPRQSRRDRSPLGDQERHARAREKPIPQPRERSLSPFSKRLALTQAMNSGR